MMRNATPRPPSLPALPLRRPHAGRRSRGLLLIALLATTATGQQDPLSESAFPRFLGIAPNGQRIELPAVTAGQTIVSTGFLVDTLKSMREWRDALRTQCIGPQMDSHATTINDNRVLTDPEWFQDCAQLAAKLANGVGALDKAFKAWNAALGTNYASPRGDPADLHAWAQTRTTMLTFGIACDKASRAIVASGQPGSPVSAQEVFVQHERLCPPEWATLFKPMATRTGGSETPHAAPSLDEELDAIGRGDYARTGTVNGDETAAQAALRSRRASGGVTLAELEQHAMAQPGAGQVAGMQIFGGQSGLMAEALASAAKANKALPVTPGNVVRNGTPSATHAATAGNSPAPTNARPDAGLGSASTRSPVRESANPAGPTRSSGEHTQKYQSQPANHCVEIVPRGFKCDGPHNRFMTNICPLHKIYVWSKVGNGAWGLEALNPRQCRFVSYYDTTEPVQWEACTFDPKAGYGPSRGCRY